MEQVQTQAPKTRNILETSVSFYQDLLGYVPEQTSLQQIPEAQWNEFATQRGLNPNSSGIYFPRNQTAIIQGKNPLSLFHEYFGHGLYCEQNLTGRKLVDLERKLLEEEKEEFLLIIDRIMYLVRKNKRIAFKRLIKKEEGEFVDELVEFDKKYFNPFMLKYHEKFEKIWKEEILKGDTKERN